MRSVLSEEFVGRLPPEAAVWFKEAVDAAVDRQQFFRAWSAMGRRLGHVADEGRALLLIAAIEARPPHEHLLLVDELHRTGDLNEKAALLRALPRLPDPARFVAVAVDAVRSNADSIIQAIALDNPYPARHFPEAAYNQMVVKCLFNGLSLARVVGLSDRRTPELRRMVAGLASERRAAGRQVPDDVALVLDGGS